MVCEGGHDGMVAYGGYTRRIKESEEMLGLGFGYLIQDTPVGIS